MRPELIPLPFATDAPAGNVDTIPVSLSPGDAQQAATWSQGFPSVTMTPLPAGGLPPRGQSFNGVLKVITEHLVFLGGGGQYRWSNAYVTSNGGYAKGDVIQADDGVLSYISLVDNNTTNFNTTPGSIGTSWRLFSYAAPPAASETVAGVMRIATQTETNNGIADDAGVTPKKLQAWVASGAAAATQTLYGVIKLASQTEVNNGADQGKAVVPATLQQWMLSGLAQATEALYGFIRIASQTDTNNGTDDAKAITPLKLKQWVQSGASAATTALYGLIKLASQSEVNNGANTDKAVTPNTLQQWMLSGAAQATEALFGFLRISSSSQATTGTDDTTAMTPAKTLQAINARANLQTLQNVIGSRSLGTSYNNATGRPITVMTSILGTTGAESCTVTVGGTTVYTGDPGYGTTALLSFVVPTGSSYVVDITPKSGSNLQAWVELR